MINLDFAVRLAHRFINSAELGEPIAIEFGGLEGVPKEVLNQIEQSLKNLELGIPGAQVLFIPADETVSKEIQDKMADTINKSVDEVEAKHK